MSNTRAFDNETAIPEEVIEWFKKILVAIRSFGLIVGGIFASLTDWVLGGIIFGIALSSYDPWLGTSKAFLVGAMISMALWGIQIMLWQFVLQNGFDESNKRLISGWTLGILLMTIALKFGDDFTDVGAVIYIMQNNPLSVKLDATLYKSLYYCMLTIVWILTGFSEAFLSFAIYFLRNPSRSYSVGGSRGRSSTRRGGVGSTRPSYRPSTSAMRPATPLGSARPAPKPTPNSQSRPFSEPTYHPIGMSRQDDDSENRYMS